jgi:transposase
MDDQGDGRALLDSVGLRMIFVTDTATVFQVRPRHRNEEVREVIGDAYAGVLVTDRGKSYDAQELAA